jgi:predicted TPR repeat methyltransferase
MGDDARARQELDRVTREQPGHVNAWFNLGVVAGAAGDKKTAIRAWEQYLKLDPNGERAAGIRDELKRMKATP